MAMHHNLGMVNKRIYCRDTARLTVEGHTQRHWMHNEHSPTSVHTRTTRQLTWSHAAILYSGPTLGSNPEAPMPWTTPATQPLSRIYKIAVDDKTSTELLRLIHVLPLARYRYIKYFLIFLSRPHTTLPVTRGDAFVRLCSLLAAVHFNNNHPARRTIKIRFVISGN